MKYRVIEMIFTDKTKAWKELVNKNGWHFWMLHIKVQWLEKTDPEIFVSKYYTTDEGDKLKEKIKVWEVYHIEVRQSWEYYNIKNIMDLEGTIII